MANNEEKLKVTITADTAPFKRGMTMVGASMRSASSGAISAFRGMASTFGSAMSQVAHHAKVAATIVGTAFAGVSIMVGKRGIEYNATIEQSTIAWETLLGSQKAGVQMMSELVRLGQFTPFSTEDFDQAAKLLKGYGFEAKDIVPTMIRLGDATSALGGNGDKLNRIALAIGQIKAKGKLSAQEVNQLAENGIGAWNILSKAMGKSTAELMKMGEKGELLSENVIPILLKGMDQYKGAMDKQNKTFNGMIEELKDGLSILSGKITMPIFEYLKSQLPKVNNLVNGTIADLTKNPEKVKKVFNQIGSIIGPAAKLIGSSLSNIYNAVIKPLFEFISQNKGIVTGFFDSFLQIGKQIGSTVGVILKQLLDTILKPLIDIFLQNKQAILDFFNIFLDASKQIIPILSGVLLGFINSVIVPLLNFLSTNKVAVQQFFQEFGGVILQIIPVLTGILSKLMNSVILPLLNLLKENKDIIFSVLGQGFRMVKQVMDVVAPILEEIILKVKDFFMNVKVGQGAGQVFSDLGNLIKTNIPVITSIIQDVILIVKSLWDMFGPQIQTVLKVGWAQIQNIITSALKVIQGVVKFVLGLISGDTKTSTEGLKLMFQGLGSFLLNTFVNLVKLIPSLMWTLIKSIVTIISNLGQTVFAGLENMAKGIWDKMSDSGKNIVSGLLKGITAAALGIPGVLANLANDYIIKPFKAALGIHSPSRVFAELGGFIAEGVGVGIDAESKSAIGSVQSLASQMQSAFNPQLASNFDLQSSLSNLNGKASAIQQVQANRKQVITLEGDLAKLVDRVKVDVANDVSIISSGGLAF